MTNTGNSPSIQKGAPAVMQRCLITASRRTAKANAVSCTLENNVLILNASLTYTDNGVYFKGLRTQHVCEMGLCARVSYLSQSAQIQIFHNISIFAM